MPHYVIERAAAGLGELSPFRQEQTARRSCSALHGVAPGIAWVRSYITADKVFCVYSAPSAEALYAEIERWGLPPPDSICELQQVLQPDDAGEPGGGENGN